MKYYIWLVLVAAALAAGCSCASPALELSTYWEGHDFTSLDGFDDIDTAEDKFDGYIRLLDKVSLEEASENICAFLDSAALNEVAYMVWATWFEAYLHTYNSPYRNDALFAVWLDKTLEDKVIDVHALERLQQVKNVIELNVPGQPVYDFLLVDSEGKEFYVSDLRGRQTLLMLLDANCPSCLDYLEENQQEYRGRDTRLVAVLVNGSEMHIKNIESRLSSDILDRWILSWCPNREIEQGRVYDLTQIPSRILVSSEGIIENLYF